MPGPGRRMRWQPALVLLLLLGVFVAAWRLSRPTDDTIRVIYPDRPEAGPDETRWEQTGDRLETVRPGMPRAEVETVLGAPEPLQVDPVARDQGTYQTRYLAVLRKPLPFAPEVRGRCEAVLTYDASKPGHPLVRVTCTPRPPSPSKQAV